ncbi:MAG: YlzJ-like family protein [Bacillota bacterium]|jgi:hypothetical protein
MILYTIVPLEIIFQDEEAIQPSHVVNVSGKTFSVRRTNEGDIIERLHSTDPNDFLNAAWSPGSLLIR